MFKFFNCKQRPMIPRLNDLLEGVGDSVEELIDEVPGLQQDLPLAEDEYAGELLSDESDEEPEVDEDITKEEVADLLSTNVKTEGVPEAK